MIPNSYDPGDVFKSLEDAAEEMCDAEALATQLEEMKKPTLASLTLEYMAIEKSRAMAETRALADDRYETHIAGMVDAKRMANRAKAKYHNMRALADARRTQEASVRALTRAA